MSITEPRPRTEDEHIAVTRKSWALDHLAYAAGELARQRGVLDYFTERAQQYGCTPDEIAEILAAHQ
ncbi:MAG: hypothetical protein JWM31_3437 [Solirubrobacterales bacterium]|nr:hypothetical protein [Solirubrobacterales bacterium]